MAANEHPEPFLIAEQALGDLMKIAGHARPDFVTIVPGSLAMKTRFFAAEMASAALAAGGTIAADIWRLRGGGEQRVGISTREAAAGLVSFLHQSFEDQSRAPTLRGQLDASGSAANGF